MKPNFVLALFVAGAAAAQPAPAPSQAPKPPVVALRAARLFDGVSDTLVTDAVVIVEGKKILSAGRGLSVPAGANVVDLGDVTLLPGFLDAHVHLTGEMGENWYEDTVNDFRRGVPERAIRAVPFARRTLLAGFTTVRLVGADEFIDVGLRNAINAGVAPGPRILTAVHALGARGGHCDLGGYPYLLFGKEPGFVEGIASGPDAFRDAVRAQKKYGADVIKVCATGGVLSLSDEVDTPQITQAEMDALVDEAHRLRMKTAAHAHGAEGAKVAIRAGIDSIEHGSFLDDEALRMMKEKGTWLVPTLMAAEVVSGREGKRELPPEIAAKGKLAGEAMTRTFRKAVESGVRIAFGTDSGVSPHGKNAQEFALMVRGGMTPAQALRAATSEGAKLFGLEKSVGRIAPGFDADLVAVPGNPLIDIRVTEKVVFVMKGGKIEMAAK